VDRTLLFWAVKEGLVSLCASFPLFAASTATFWRRYAKEPENATKSAKVCMQVQGGLMTAPGSVFLL
jgi:hypothetical protein